MRVIPRVSVLAFCLLVSPIATPQQSEPGARSVFSPILSIDGVYEGFKNPPPGYGEVAFYWWLGDTLTRERLLWQLDQLKGKGVTGLQINYAHSDSGGLIWGLTLPSQPRLFSDEWWELFGWFMREAKQRGMSVSVSDYTLGVGQESYVDEALADHPELNGSELKFAKRMVAGPTLVVWQLPDEPLSLSAYRIGNDSLPVPETRLDLLQHVKDRTLKWRPVGGKWMIFSVWVERVVPSLDPMHAISGKAYIEKFFQRFEERFPGESGKGINYFFSDELSFRLQYPIWDDAFVQEFMKRKGYDIRPNLASLFADTGPETPKIRLDYNDVMVSLSEEHFFRPLYEWHQKRGMTFGCDHGGRGRDVAEFGDYFRTQRWNQGPGCDQPRLEQDIIKNKVAASIAHLYQRPRVWLEGFHSSGWGTTSAEIADAVFGNFVMGQNLLTLHGLYYSTHGGWWEWAPPCNHFRMPYWQHIDPFMQSVQRLSYLLSQGDHRCDVAVVYPVEPVIAGTAGQESVTSAFAAGEALYNAGIDFDFIDYESLARATIHGGRILVSGEEYRVLILPSMKTIRFASLAKAHELFASGGTVINVGSVPEACEKGRGNREFSALQSRLFGNAPTERAMVALLKSSQSGGSVFECNDRDSLIDLVSRLFPRDFAVVSRLPGPPKPVPRIMHRRIGLCDLYAVYNLPQGTECFFRSVGRVEHWNPWSGDRRPLLTARRSNEGTIVRLPSSPHDVQLIAFVPGETDVVVEASTLSTIDSVTVIDGHVTVWGTSTTGGKVEAIVKYKGEVHNLVGELPASRVPRSLAGAWECEVQPSLDNRWGDFHWPPTEGMIGPEVHRFAYRDESSASTRAPGSTLMERIDTVSCSFGPQFWKLGPLPGIPPHDSVFSGSTFNPDVPVAFNGTTYTWHPYHFSWRWGVENDPGHQGYHGLKEEVHDEFIRLGKMTHEWTTTERHVEEGGTFYCLFTGVVAPVNDMYRIEQGRVHPVVVRINGVPVDTTAGSVHLNAGINTLLLWYDRPCVTYFVLRRSDGAMTPGRGPGEHRSEKPLAMRWHGDPALLRFDARFTEDKPAGWYTFMSAPGMNCLRFMAHGRVEVFVGGGQVRVTKGAVREDGGAEYAVDLDKGAATPVEVAIRIEHQRGYYGGAAIPEPVELGCAKGVLEIGDWSRNDGLRSYSGGMWYRTSVHMSADEVQQNVELNLGSVVSTAEVWVNGTRAGLKVSPPWVYDISAYLHEGENSLEVLVYNTAANHYTSIPTRYRGVIAAGILGPVTLSFSVRVILKEQ